MKVKGQSEFVGFAIIIIIVAVLFLVFLSISIEPKKETFSSQDTESFLQSVLEYTTTCAKGGEHRYLSIEKLIRQCNSEGSCYDNSDSCEILQETLEKLTNAGWQINENSPTKGYEFTIDIAENNVISISEGEITEENRGSVQTFSGDIDIKFILYY